MMLPLRLPLLVAAALLIGLAVTPARSQSISTQSFFRFNEFDDVKISPDGQHLAMAIPADDFDMLVIMDVDSEEVVAQFDTQRNQTINEFYWANNERIVFAPAFYLGGLDVPFFAGEIYAFNIDNTRKFKLAGFQAGDFNAYMISDLMRGDDNHIRVVRREVRRRSIERSRPTSYVLDINRESRTITGRTQANLRLPVRSPLPWGELYSDNNGVVRIAAAISEDRETLIHYRGEDSDEWVDVSDVLAKSQINENTQFLTFAEDNQSVSLLKYTDTKTMGIVRYFPETELTETIFEHPRFDLTAEDVVYSSTNDSVIGVKFYGDVLETHYFGDHPEIAIHKSLDAAFPGQLVKITSFTASGDRAVLLVSGPKNPGEYLMMDVQSSQLTRIGSANSELNPEAMGDVQPFAITTSEDLQIHGVVTFPKSDESNQPMVVIPHGGPIGARDSIAFNTEAQFFAHHGYVVMQVNFRGSGGYGYDFQRKGYEQWGSGMIDDISLAVTWAIQNGLADRDSICILGGSYGAFAAISSVVQEPQKYQCAIGYSGVYDLTMLDESDIPWNPGGGAYLDEALGTNEEELTRQSPVNFTDNIEVPIFLAHGGEDARAPIEQANQLREALDESGVEYEWLYKRNEGHGFYQEENRVEFYDAVLAFLGRHIN